MNQNYRQQVNIIKNNNAEIINKQTNKISIQKNEINKAFENILSKVNKTYVCLIN